MTTEEIIALLLNRAKTNDELAKHYRAGDTMFPELDGLSAFAHEHTAAELHELAEVVAAVVHQRQRLDAGELCS